MALQVISSTWLARKTLFLIDFFVAGAVGKQLLKDVLKNGKYAKVVAVGRRPVELDESIPQDKLVRLLVYKAIGVYSCAMCVGSKNC